MFYLCGIAIFFHCGWRPSVPISFRYEESWSRYKEQTSHIICNHVLVWLVRTFLLPVQKADRGSEEII